MTRIWNGINLLKTIAENEAGAAKLYRAIANEAGLGEKFFDLLAQDEERHEKLYKELIEKFSKEIEIEIVESDAEYVDMLIEKNLTVDDELIEKARTIFTKSQIFDLAEQAERNAVMFVMELQKLYPYMAKDEIDIILTEEKAHLKKILDRKKESGMLLKLGL